MTQPVPSVRKPLVQREWPVQCVDSDANPSVCVIEVARGVVEVVGPDNKHLFGLEGEHVVGFREAFDEAVARAGLDVRAGGEEG